MITIDDLNLYDLSEVALLVGMPRARVEVLVRAEHMAGVVHGGRWMVAAEEVERFLREWTPPERVSRVGSTRRHRPPTRPADLDPAG